MDKPKPDRNALARLLDWLDRRYAPTMRRSLTQREWDAKVPGWHQEFYDLLDTLFVPDATDPLPTAPAVDEGLTLICPNVGGDPPHEWTAKTGQVVNVESIINNVPAGGAMLTARCPEHQA